MGNTLNISVELLKDENKKASTKTFVTNIYGRIKNQKEQELTNGNIAIGKYWVCAQTVYFGIRPNKKAMYSTIEQAQAALVQLYKLNLDGDFVIAKDIETGKYFIKA